MLRPGISRWSLTAHYRGLGVCQDAGLGRFSSLCPPHGEGKLARTGTSVGVMESVPFPSEPSMSSPQHATVPSAFHTHTTLPSKGPTPIDTAKASVVKVDVTGTGTKLL